MRIPWGRVWVTLAAIAAVALGTLFVLRYLGAL